MEGEIEIDGERQEEEGRREKEERGTWRKKRTVIEGEMELNQLMVGREGGMSR